MTAPVSIDTARLVLRRPRANIAPAPAACSVTRGSYELDRDFIAKTRIPSD